LPSVLALGIELATTAPAKKSSGSSVVLILLVVAVGGFYWFVIRPRSMRQRQQREQLKAAQVGDEVATIGGLVGTIVAEEGDRVTISTGTGTELVFLRQAIGRRLDPPSGGDVVDAEHAGQVPGFDNPSSADAPSGDEPEQK
jgi:preprotein translocase subunit YajC